MFFYEIEYDDLNSLKLNDYNRLDLGIRYKTEFKAPDIKAEFAFSIINLLDQENIFSRNYYLEDIEEENGEPEIFSVDKFLLKRTPQLLVRFYW